MDASSRHNGIMRKGTKMSPEARRSISLGMTGNRNAVDNRGGRPSAYGPWVVEEAKRYLDACRDQWMGQIASRKNGAVTYKNQLDVNLPTVGGLAAGLGVPRSTLDVWGRAHSEFSDALRQIKYSQEIRLVRNGLAGTYSSAIVAMMLVANHGYRTRAGTRAKGGIDTFGVRSLSDEELQQIA